MNPSEARAHILREHDRLRELLAAAETAAARLLAGVDDADRFRGIVAELRTALAEHNAHEEALIEPMLAGVDAVAPLRIRRMVEEHAAEHAALRAHLAGPEAEIAHRMSDLAEDLLAHMEAEERTFLHPRVLGDDTPRG
ncbi:MAG TPA: hemerythrin domain-containing protein [Haliangiales bacterium]|nr:hemerythrin domain-containing protein [Haliangiales bacterium]